MVQRSDLSARFGEALRQARIDAGLTQETLGYKAGLSRNYVGEVERGEKSPTLDVVAALAKALGIHVGAMIGPPQ